jgi:2'-5' RNA ligase
MLRSSIRAFVSIRLAPQAVGTVQKIQQQLQSKLPHDVVKWTGPEQLHLTMKFFGNVSAGEIHELASALERAVHGIHSFNLNLEDIGCFPSTKRPSVIWVGVTGELAELGKLQDQIDRETEGAGSHSEVRDFHPHLTIGRLKGFTRASRDAGSLIQKTELPRFEDWPVREIEFIESRLSAQGSVYSRLAGPFKLQG